MSEYKYKYKYIDPTNRDHIDALAELMDENPDLMISAGIGNSNHIEGVKVSEFDQSGLSVPVSSILEKINCDINRIKNLQRDISSNEALSKYTQRVWYKSYSGLCDDGMFIIGLYDDNDNAVLGFYIQPEFIKMSTSFSDKASKNLFNLEELSKELGIGYYKPKQS